MFKKGIITLRDLATEEGGLVTVGQILARIDFTASEKFGLIAIIDALAVSWRHHLKTCNNYDKKNSTFSERTCLELNGQRVC